MRNRLPFPQHFLVVAINVGSIPEGTTLFERCIQNLNVSLASKNYACAFRMTDLEPVFVFLGGTIKRREGHKAKTNGRDDVVSNLSGVNCHDEKSWGCFDTKLR